MGLESVGRGCEEHIRGASGAGTNRFRTVRAGEQVNKGAFERAWEDRMTAPVREEKAQVWSWYEQKGASCYLTRFRPDGGLDQPNLGGMTEGEV